MKPFLQDIFQHFHIFSTRTLDVIWSQARILDNRILSGVKIRSQEAFVPHLVSIVMFMKN